MEDWDKIVEDWDKIVEDLESRGFCKINYPYFYSEGLGIGAKITEIHEYVSHVLAYEWLGGLTCKPYFVEFSKDTKLVVLYMEHLTGEEVTRSEALEMEHLLDSLAIRHNDLHPGNILRVSPTKLKVIDWECMFVPEP